jgi:hypothetical protein
MVIGPLPTWRSSNDSQVPRTAVSRLLTVVWVRAPGGESGWEVLVGGCVLGSGRGCVYAAIVLKDRATPETQQSRGGAPAAQAPT